MASLQQKERGIILATEPKVLFVSPDEVEVDRVDITSTKGGAGIGQDHLILTNKTVYYKGAAMALDGSNQYAAGASIVDVSYISGTTFSMQRMVILMIMGLVFAIGSLVIAPAARSALGWLFVAAAVFLIFVFFAGAPKVLMIHYSGGTLKIQVKGLSAGTSVANFHRFCNSIHKAAEDRRAALNK